MAESLPIYLDGWTLERVQERARALGLSLGGFVELLVYQHERERERRAKSRRASEQNYCRNCHRRQGLDGRDGLCVACYRYYERHGALRPERLWNRTTPCWQCGTPRAPGVGGGGCCNSCYHKARYRGQSAADLHYERQRRAYQLGRQRKAERGQESA